MSAEGTEQSGWTDPAAPGANVGQRGDFAAAESSLDRLQRVVARFNASEAARVVSGLNRTLGKPWVSIGAAAGSSSQARVTVAWELCWYQWGIDLGDERMPVATLGKGDEIEQLDGSAREWNATADSDGRLVLGTAPPEPPARGSEALR